MGALPVSPHFQRLAPVSLSTFPRGDSIGGMGVLGHVLFCLFNLFYLFLFLAVLGLHFCTRAFSSCGERGLLFVALRRPLLAVASLVAEQGFRHAGFSSCGTRAQ